MAANQALKYEDAAAAVAATRTDSEGLASLLAFQSRSKLRR